MHEPSMRSTEGGRASLMMTRTAGASPRLAGSGRYQEIEQSSFRGHLGFDFPRRVRRRLRGQRGPFARSAFGSPSTR